MGKENETFYKLNGALVKNVGDSAAIFHAILVFASKYRKKDANGYFEVEDTYIHDHLGWYPRKIDRARNKLISVGLLRFKRGVNQNIKHKYRL
jgi:hypothetical protein